MSKSLETLHFSDDTFVSLKTLNLQSTFSLMETFGTGRNCPSYRDVLLTEGRGNWTPVKT